MIIKSFEIKKFNLADFKLILLYGVNKGLKDEVIKSHILNDFCGEISRYEENEILENVELTLESFMNGSLFDDQKIIIIMTAKKIIGKI